MAVTSYLQTFEETRKVAYSHGLEAIYALENVDIKSVRRLAPSTPSSSKIVESKEISATRKDNKPQLELDFGPEYRDWIEPFLAREPIQVLGLSRHAERCLLDHGKCTLQDLSQANLHDAVFFKGMGQGHIDETQQKLQLYLDGRSLQYTHTVDYISWLRSIVTSLDRKKIFVSLQPYQLSDLFSLLPSETAEIGRLTMEKKQELRRETANLLRIESLKKTILKDLEKIAQVFVKPWIRKRLGIATEQEILERVQRTSTKGDTARSVLKFLSDLYFDRNFPIGHPLYRVDQGVYCADLATASHYQHVIKTASSYFYKPTIQYNLPELVTFIERELASQWIGFQEGFIEKALRHSSSFRVRKGPEGLLVITLS